jgi:hypothetical protein
VDAKKTMQKSEQHSGGELNNIKNRSVTPYMYRNKKGGTEVDVLSSMNSAFPTSHLEMSALKASVSANTAHHTNVEDKGDKKVGGKK